MTTVSEAIKEILDNLLDEKDERQKAGRMVLSEMTEHLKETGKYICGISGLPCSFCEAFCSSRKEKIYDDRG